jgi:hypothetical protein
MTDNPTPNRGPEMGSRTDDTFAWTEPEPNQGDASAKAKEWISQLQAMIENLATQAAPVVREVGAKAAELAALAGDKAGPAAAKAAELAGRAGVKVAEKSRDFAADLRRDPATKTGTETAADVAESISGESVSTDYASTDATSDTPTRTGVA